jgi:hypothetical protein
VHGTMAALHRMVPRDRGKIVQVGSALSYRAIPLQAAYCGSKFAIRGFTDSIRTELMHDGSSVEITMVQLPGLNTTQFNWCRSKLPEHPKPVPPIYQPEVAAEAIWWAAHHRRREIWVGYSTVQAILGGMLAPRFADWYLARTAFEGQQVKNMPIHGQRQGNLFEPLPKQAATHGIFDAEAKSGSVELWVARHRRALGAGTAAAVGLLGALAGKLAASNSPPNGATAAANGRRNGLGARSAAALARLNGSNAKPATRNGAGNGSLARLAGLRRA